MSLYFHWSFGNRKLKKTNTVAFDLPPLIASNGDRICRGAGACASYCYARCGYMSMPHALQPREENWIKVRRLGHDDLVDALTSDILQLKNKGRTIRHGGSGDFPDQKYLDVWKQVARKMPGKLFYAYTKSLDLDFGDRPTNFRIVQSIGGRFDHLINYRRPHLKIFGSAKDIKDAGYTNASVSDAPAQQGVVRIGIIVHGQRFRRFWDSVQGRLFA